MWLALALGVMAQAAPASSEALAHVAIAQALATPPAITLYLDVLDEHDSVPAALDPAQLHVTVGANRAQVTAVRRFADASEGVAVVLLVDVSKSISTSEMAGIQEALRAWTTRMGPLDRAALVTFGNDVSVASDFTADRAALASAIDALVPTGNRTVLHEALQRALELGRRGDRDLPRRRAIVLLSDGKDEGSGLAADDVAAAIREDRTPIYAVGYSRLRGDDRRNGFDALARFAANSGGIFREARRDDVAPTYAALRGAIERVFVADVSCEACTGDGSLKRLDVSLASGSRTLEDGMDIRMRPGADPAPHRSDVEVPAPSPSITRWWPFALGGGLVALFGAGAVIVRRRSARAGVTAPGSGTAPEGVIAGPIGSSGHPPIPRVRVTCHFRHQRTEPFTTTVEGAARIGTGPACALQLADDPDIASEHCELVAEPERLFIRPLDREHPTFVNGVPITTRLALDSGDLVMLGRTEMRLTFEAVP
jgi:VWFA-related protein